MEVSSHKIHLTEECRHNYFKYLDILPLNPIVNGIRQMKNLISRLQGENDTPRKKKGSTARDREDTLILRQRIQDKLAHPRNRSK